MSWLPKEWVCAQGGGAQTGPQGPPGPKGDTGAVGPKGDTGIQGPKGDTGNAGATGPQGSTGAQGVKGDTGAQGPTGNTGPQGQAGAQGATGSQGVKGDTGLTGSQGPAGNNGAQGIQGIQGIQGVAGVDGVRTATTAFGYSTGAGGTFTQLTSKSTTVLLNKLCGNITLNAAALAAGAIVTFVFTNSTVAAEDQIIATHHSGGTFGSYLINARATGAGAASVAVRNTSAASLSEAIVIKFTVLKGVAS